jgi:hypothetical protein
VSDAHAPRPDRKQLIKGFVASLAFIAAGLFMRWAEGVMVHQSPGVAIEVPWDAEGNRAFLGTMQEKLPGFDNGAVIAASGMLHGFKQVWPSENERSDKRAILSE